MQLSLPAVLLASASLTLAAPTAAMSKGTAAKMNTRLAKAVRPHFLNAVNKVSRDVSRKAGEETLSTGGTAPFGKFWDPAGFSKDLTPNELKRYREAELTHGRVAMLGALGFLTQEAFHPLFGGDIDGPAIKHFEEIVAKAPTFWYPVMLAIAVAELGRARIGWQDPFDGGSLFGLREGYTPGDIGFDPLGLKPQNSADYMNMQNKEINNGRLAMMALAGFIAQELANGKPIVS
eukprot:CAMPEP_0184478024 /NCGR_PEP_ID=MMETSP0113_2-20130426/142_1 /TAXON_ID=91329 /ORGANISM="Norrisiella sphaerica, Strain BC52" /LENGTH=233 /DNA_ID=CAMNT_0026855657 /DNA_START=112 /DNA_END=813 /DNA_ORIENTATION=+